MNALRTARRAHAPADVVEVLAPMNRSPAAKPTFKPGELNVFSTPRDVTDVSRALRHTGRRVMLVPTMGALHDGHRALVRAAKRVPGSVVVVSIFVNPLQFGAGEDLDAYPRTLDDDLALLRGEDVEIVFAPTAAAMYPDGLRTTVQPGPLAAELEGGPRPTHFAGVLTVVSSCCRSCVPTGSSSARRTISSWSLIRQMVADLNLDVAVIGVPTVRECRRAGDVIAQPLPRPGAARSGRGGLGGAAGRHAHAAGRCAGRADRSTRACSTPCPRLRSTTWSCAIPGWVRCRPPDLAGCWSPPGSDSHQTVGQHRNRDRNFAGTGGLRASGPDGNDALTGTESPWRN